MLELDSQFVKQGYWLESDRGSVLGKTITTDVRTGTLVVSILAILVTLATSHSWNLLLFALHQYRANGKAADVLSRQQQVLLRMGPAPASFLIEWIKIYWVARGKVKNALPRLLWQMILALLFATGTVVAGVFSAYAVGSTDVHVLVESPHCGPLDVGAMMNSSRSLSYIANVWSRSGPYVQDCYKSSNSSPPKGCDIFINTNTKTISERVPCPFEESLCVKDDRPAFTIDSGLIDANDLFGWNLRRQDKIQFRRRLTCGVLETQGHLRFVNATTSNTTTRPLIFPMYSKYEDGNSTQGDATHQLVQPQDDPSGVPSLT